MYAYAQVTSCAHAQCGVIRQTLVWRKVTVDRDSGSEKFDESAVQW